MAIPVPPVPLAGSDSAWAISSAARFWAPRLCRVKMSSLFVVVLGLGFGLGPVLADPCDIRFESVVVKANEPASVFSLRSLGMSLVSMF